MCFRRPCESYKDPGEERAARLKILKVRRVAGEPQNAGAAAFQVDVGFVQDGVAKGEKTDNLVSLGSVFYEPLFIFYRDRKQLDALSQLSGKRLAIGENGTGTRAWACAEVLGCPAVRCSQIQHDASDSFACRQDRRSVYDERFGIVSSCMTC